MVNLSQVSKQQKLYQFVKKETGQLYATIVQLVYYQLGPKSRKK